ncbi:MAG: hypothetical protein ACREGR_01125 [Minisyncoccia bacterium]
MNTENDDRKLWSKEDSERFFNMVKYKLWLTDEELKEQAPWFMVGFMILIVIITAICWCFFHPH